ncbi:MAG TPA: hypothetical protein ENK49_09590 [Gammaproteobacteria bacterium]|nr:hypothetical protein [Gammaproteobacteria bacterium]
MNDDLVLNHTGGLAWLTLFASGGTLICCALPATLVTLGLGATVAAFTSSFPLLITLSEHKVWVFVLSGALLLLSGWLLYRAGRRCPVDPALGALCARSLVWNRRLYWLSVFLWLIGFSVAYLALPLRIWLEN